MKQALAAVALAVALRGDAACDVAASGEAIEMPGPRSRDAALDADPARANARCEGCHADIAAEWRASLHRAAHDDPAYRRALAIEPLAFCEQCHAPEADPAGARRGETAEAIGVACVTCHGAEAVVAAPGRDRAAPHAVARSAAFATAAACAGCHEFAFPDAEIRDLPAAMQRTATEHAASPSAGAACASCHMPRVDGHRSHAMIASRDPAMIRRAARVTATREGTIVRVTIARADVGHAFPTGDLFRRLTIVAEARAPGGEVVATARRSLARRFATRPQRSGALARVEIADERPGGDVEAPVVTLDLGPLAAGAVITWRVDHERVDHPRGDRDDDAIVAGSILVAEGSLAP